MQNDGPPPLAGVLETALYVDDMDRARAFYEAVLGLSPMFRDARLTAYPVGGRSALLLFRRGAATATVHLPGGAPADRHHPAARRRRADPLRAGGSRGRPAGLAGAAGRAWRAGGRAH